MKRAQPHGRFCIQHPRTTCHNNVLAFLEGFMAKSLFCITIPCSSLTVVTFEWVLRPSGNIHPLSWLALHRQSPRGVVNVVLRRPRYTSLRSQFRPLPVMVRNTKSECATQPPHHDTTHQLNIRREKCCNPNAVTLFYEVETIFRSCVVQLRMLCLLHSMW